MEEKTTFQKVVDSIWGVIKALPKALLKTRLGWLIVAALVNYSLKLLGVNLPTEVVTDILNKLFDLINAGTISPDLVADSLIMVGGAGLMELSRRTHKEVNGNSTGNKDGNK